MFSCRWRASDFTRWAGRKICQAWKQFLSALRAFSYTLIDGTKVQIFHCGSRMFTLFLWKKLWEIMINSTFAWLNWTRRYEETKGYHRLKRIISWEILRFLKGHEASYRGFAKQNLRAFVSSCSIISVLQCYSSEINGWKGKIYSYIYIYNS